jgi:hypothetical protein
MRVTSWGMGLAINITSKGCILTDFAGSVLTYSINLSRCGMSSLEGFPAVAGLARWIVEDGGAPGICDTEEGAGHATSGCIGRPQRWRRR